MAISHHSLEEQEASIKASLSVPFSKTAKDLSKVSRKLNAS
jgi:hypothetical protein